MPQTQSQSPDGGSVLRLDRPKRQTRPMVVCSPHSGTAYPAAFLAQTRLSMAALRSSEDTHVDRIVAAAPRLGAPLLCALMPRVYVDVNREPLELDPALFRDPLPPEANTASGRIRAGLGTIPRVAGEGQAIYRQRLSFAHTRERLDRVYQPYHAALAALIEETRAAFGQCIVLDCHSMPASAVSGVRPRAPDIVLGDRHGTSCDPRITATADRVLTDLGFTVRRNAPYAGGFTTQHYGRPTLGVHALQIEMNRALYMDETTRTPEPGLVALAEAMRAVMDAVSTLAGEPLAAE